MEQILCWNEGFTLMAKIDFIANEYTLKVAMKIVSLL